MIVTQSDVAQLDDNTLKLMVIDLNQAAVYARDAGSRRLFHEFARALVRVIRERRLTILVAEADLLDDEEEGELLAERPGESGGEPR